MDDNAKAFSVSELSGALKRSIEDQFGYVRVRGEVSGWRGPHASGHCYFCLKDATARIDAVIWKTAFARMKVKPQEGLEVIATGKITTFPGKSAYQIIVEAVEPAGVGALMALIEERRRRLAAEGLFDAARKQLLPHLPGVIGVVTSPSGAVVRDILHRIADRFPRRVLIWPVRVQGETSAEEVARAIHGFNALEEGGATPRPHVIIVARGGGSLEDLLSFSEEAVLRAAAASGIPLVSAIGHETDWTLLDHVADLRAPTPTGAAEMCVPVLSVLLADLRDLARRHETAALRLLERRRADLRSGLRGLPRAGDIVNAPRQRFDRASERLDSRREAARGDRRLRLGALGMRLARHAPQAELAARRGRLAAAGDRLRRAGLADPRRALALAGLAHRLWSALGGRARLEAQRSRDRRARLDRVAAALRRAPARSAAGRVERLRNLGKLVASFDYRNVLARGFAVVRDAEGRPVRAAAALSPGAAIGVEFADGRVEAQVAGAEIPAPEPRVAKPKRARGGADPVEQGSLF